MTDAKAYNWLQQRSASRALKSATQFVDGAPVMLHETVRQSCVENQGYETPELNDQLFLQHRGFRLVRQDPHVRVRGNRSFGAGGERRVGARGTRRGGLQS